MIDVIQSLFCAEVSWAVAKVAICWRRAIVLLAQVQFK